MSDPLRLTLEVACPPDHAFHVWTSRIGTWWPVDHSVSGEPDLEVVLEPAVGGRIYERTRSGTEHDWGRVTRFEPPRLLAYQWHIGRDPSASTDVEIAFVPDGDRRTRVEIVHGGWDRLGEEAETWRGRNRHGWDTLLPHVAAAINEEHT